ncbi:MAG: FAD:protein transferase [Microbacteriaceae bacterium]|nr:FAD:protein transferase [Microbacteriaceae bacterium]
MRIGCSSTIVDMNQRPPRTVHVEHVMGTVVSLDLRGPGDHRAAIAAAVAWFHEVDRRFSPFRPDSETCRYGRGELADGDRSPELAEIVAACEAVAARSGGAFAARRDGSFDPSAYVKGWSVERAGELLAAHGRHDWSLDAGGDVLTSGEPGPDRLWRVGVQNPFDRVALATVLTGRRLAVATSGTYERGAHIVDARSGGVPSGVASVTVVGADLGFADAYSTAAFALASAGPAWLAGIDGYESYTVFADRTVVATAGFPLVVHGVPIATVPVRSDLMGAA